MQLCTSNLCQLFHMQDRISRDGSLITGSLPGKQEHAAQQQSQPRPALLPATAPVLPPIAEAQLQELVGIIADSRHDLKPRALASQAFVLLSQQDNSHIYQQAL